MQIGKDEVQRIAKLARLEISDTEQEAFSRQLSGILSYVEQLKKIDTTGVEPTAAVVGQTNVFRPDKSRACLSQEAALTNAPEAEDGHFRVPPILENR